MTYNNDDEFLSGVKKGAMHVSHGKDERFWGDRGAGILLIAKDTGRILLVLRSQEVNEPGTWGMPGGKIDSESESPASAAKREAREEVGFSGGLELIPAHVFKSGTFTFHNFFGVIDSEFEPRLDWENDDARWVSLDGLPNNLHFGVKSLLSNSGNELKKIIGSSEIVKETKKVKHIIDLLLEREIVANQFRKPEYQPTKKVDEPDGGPLGHVLFSPSRADGVDTTEHDTDLERKIFNSIISHIHADGDYMLSQNVDSILGLINSGKYDLLKPIDGHVYRAMKFSINESFDDFGLTIEDIKNNATNQPWIFAPNNLVLKPMLAHYEIMSWTYSLSEMAKTEIAPLSENEVMIIVRAAIPGSGTFIMNPNMTKKISGLESFAKERETLSYGEIKIDKILVYYEARNFSSNLKHLESNIENILTVLVSRYIKNAQDIFDNAEKEALDYINTLEEFSNTPLKSIDELSRIYSISNLMHLRNYVKKENANKLIENIYNIIFKVSDSMKKLSGSFYKKTPLFLAKIQPNVMKIGYIDMILHDLEIFPLNDRILSYSNIDFTNGFEEIFIKKIPNKQDIKKASVSISNTNVENNNIRKELNNIRSVLFRMFQNEP